MRKCIRCGAEMNENYDIKIQRGGYGIEISSGTKLLSKRIGKPQVAICLSCGEISLYIENIAKANND